VPRNVRTTSSGDSAFIEGDIEFLNVNNSTSFSAVRIELNPGLSSTFGTRAANIAKGYERYRFVRLQASYVPTEAVTTTSGQVYLAAEYDPNDDAPSSLQALSTYQTQRNGRVYEKVTLDFNIASMFSGIQSKKVRCGPLPGDLSVHDPGSLILATDSGANANAIGKMWLHFRIQLSSPQTDPSTRTPKDLVALNLSATQALASGVAEPVDFDENITSGFTLTNDGSGVYTAPCGAFRIHADVNFQNSASEASVFAVELLVNSASTTPPQVSVVSLTTVATNRVHVASDFFASLDEGDTLTILVTATGAAGTLTLVPDATRLFVQAV
jgi:hypothetical protein